jgi:hypothetical protein
MDNYTIIDRRLNPKGKNLSNRQRFLKRANDWIKEKIRKRAIDRDITSEEDESITISTDGISEPVFDYDYQSGDWDRVLPGNRDFVVGDTIKREKSGQGKGKDASDNGDGEDTFVFTISKEEYLDILFEDLELPDLIKESEETAIRFARKRSGFSTSGTPNNLDLERSLKNALGRRIALAFPLDRKIKEKEEEIEKCIDSELLIQLQQELLELKTRRNAVSYIDQVDVKYKRYTQIPLPSSQAVVFCLMDVSGSMEEREKEIAKRFFLLLYLFLQRKYEKVDIRFVRHTTTADECTEHQFFYDKESGGTMVSTGVKKVNEIINEEYPLDDWNIYVVQASDGDNFSNDENDLKSELEEILPKCQYYVYNEVKPGGTSEYMNLERSYQTNVFTTMKQMTANFDNLAIVNIGSVDDVVSIFRKVFTKQVKNGK